MKGRSAGFPDFLPARLARLSSALRRLSFSRWRLANVFRCLAIRHSLSIFHDTVFHGTVFHDSVFHDIVRRRRDERHFLRAALACVADRCVSDRTDSFLQRPARRRQSWPIFARDEPCRRPLGPGGAADCSSGAQVATAVPAWAPTTPERPSTSCESPARWRSRACALPGRTRKRRFPSRPPGPCGRSGARTSPARAAGRN